MFTISPADGNVIVKQELAISQVAKYMRFYPTGSSSDDVPRFCLRVAVYGRDGKTEDVIGIQIMCTKDIFDRVLIDTLGRRPHR